MPHHCYSLPPPILKLPSSSSSLIVLISTAEGRQDPLHSGRGRVKRAQPVNKEIRSSIWSAKESQRRVKRKAPVSLLVLLALLTFVNVRSYFFFLIGCSSPLEATSGSRRRAPHESQPPIGCRPCGVCACVVSRPRRRLFLPRNNYFFLVPYFARKVCL